MATIAGSFEFWIETNGIISHDFRVRVEQDFDIRGINDLKEWGRPEVTVYAGDMLLWVGKPSEMSGWLKAKVEERIERETDWGISRADIAEALEEEAETEQFYREHAAGAI